MSDTIARAALVYRQALLRLQQNEGEIANGGRDDGSDQAAVDQAEQVLDNLLRQKFGPCWDLRMPK